MPKSPLDAKTARRVAVAADADDRTVQKCARGEEVRGHVAERIRVALRAVGFEPKSLPSTSTSGGNGR